MNSYQAGLEAAEERALIVEQYIDDHELLKDHDAFEEIFDKAREARRQARNDAALKEVWRILQTRSAHETDIAIADIRSVLDGLILAAAGEYADNAIRYRGFTGSVK